MLLVPNGWYAPSRSGMSSKNSIMLPRPLSNTVLTLCFVSRHTSLYPCALSNRFLFSSISSGGILPQPTNEEKASSFNLLRCRSDLGFGRQRDKNSNCNQCKTNYSKKQDEFLRETEDVVLDIVVESYESSLL